MLEWSPVGRSLAFDPAHGRLWVICGSCRNWNLVPLLERWEAVEELERGFEGAFVEKASENVALGRLGDGTAVVRVGKVEQPEFAVWRYADRLVGRWKKNTAVGIGGLGAIIAASAATGLSLGAAGLGGVAIGAGILELRDHRPVLRTEQGEVLRLRDARKVRVVPRDTPSGWNLEVPRFRDPVLLEGHEAVRTLRTILPRANLEGGKPSKVRRALSHVASAGSPDDVIRRISRELGHSWNMDPHHTPLSIGNWGRARPHRVSTAVLELRLALEMAVNEREERRALEGELSRLEREWREAEELASISDDLLIPEEVRRWIRARKRGEVPAAPPRG